MCTSVGSKVKTIRQAKGLLIRELAAACSLTESYICKLENNRLQPNIKMVFRIAEGLGCNAVDLIPSPEEQKENIQKAS